MVLAKTKLRESDLIIRMVNERGSLIEAVAKGARKPSGTLSARLELLNEVELLLIEGKSLDIVKEARLINSPTRIWADPVRTAAASLVAEFSAKTVQSGLEVERVFDLIRTAISSIEGCDSSLIPASVAAFLLKGTSMIGFRPSLTRCPICSDPICFDDAGDKRFSLENGGVICDSCANSTSTIPMDGSTIQWGEALIRIRFSELGECDIPYRSSLNVLQLARMWAEAQVGAKLKSANSLRAYIADELARD